jgi:hypothetical protein
MLFLANLRALAACRLGGKLPRARPQTSKVKLGSALKSAFSAGSLAERPAMK